MVAVHLWRVRKDGGLSRPDEPGDIVQQIDLGQLPTNKSYGLMELARGTTPQVGKNPEDEVFSWPHLVFRELLLFLLVTAVVLFLAIFWNAPLEELANADSSAESREGAVVFPRPAGTGQLLGVLGRRGGAGSAGDGADAAALHGPQAQRRRPLVCPRTRGRQHDFHRLPCRQPSC